MEWALLMSLAIAAAAWERFSYHAGKEQSSVRDERGPAILRRSAAVAMSMEAEEEIWVGEFCGLQESFIDYGRSAARRRTA